MVSPAELQKDAALRARALTHVDALKARFGPVMDWSVIAQGMPVEDGVVCLATRARGIFAPAGGAMVAALSVRTNVPRRGRDPWYDDGIDNEGLIVYRHQGTDPDSRDNRLVRACIEHALPLIYFCGVAPARYEPLICRVVEEWPRQLKFFLAPVTLADQREMPVLSQAAIRPPMIDRAYAGRWVRQRLHQQRFREMVLGAYPGCAVCTLQPHRLLDAAHILPDATLDGVPELPNGLALCKLHHAAYDQQMLGITPDYEVRINPQVMRERNGPMLEHGIKAMDRRPLTRPRRPIDWPDPARLDQRWSALPWT